MANVLSLAVVGIGSWFVVMYGIATATDWALIQKLVDIF